MNPLDLAKEAAASENIPLEKVSSVYAELASMANESSPLEQGTVPQEFTNEKNQQITQEVQELRERAQASYTKALVVQNDAEIEDFTAVKVLTTIAAIDHNQSLIDMARARAENSEELYGEEYRILAKVDGSRDAVQRALEEVLENLGEEDSKIELRELFPLILQSFNKEEALQLIGRFHGAPEELRATLQLGIYHNDVELVRRAYQEADQYLDDEDLEKAEIYAALYSVDHNPNTKNRALEILPRSPASAPLVWADIARVDLTLESIRAMAEAIRADSITNNELAAGLMECAVLCAKAGQLGEAAHFADQIEFDDFRVRALQEICVTAAERGDYVGANAILRQLEMRHTVAHNFARPAVIAAFARAGLLDPAEELLGEIQDKPQYYLAHAQFAKALYERADAREAELMRSLDA